MNKQFVVNTHLAIRLLCLVVIGGVLIKLALFYAFYTGGSGQIVQPDTWTYWFPANRFLSSGEFRNAWGQYLFFRTPGYPLFMAGIIHWFGHNMSRIVLAQIVLSGLLTVMAFVITRRLFSVWVGLFAAVWVTLDYVLVGYTFLLLTDMVFAVLVGLSMMWGVLFFTRQNRGYLYAFCMGLSLSLATLARPVGYFLIFPIIVGVVWYEASRKTAFKKILVVLLLLVMPYLLLVGGWQVRNKVRLNTFRFSGITSVGGMRVFFPKNYARYRQAQLAKFHSFDPASITLKQDMGMLFAYPWLSVKTILNGARQLLVTPDGALRQFINTKETLAHFHRDIEIMVKLKSALLSGQAGVFFKLTITHLFSFWVIFYLFWPKTITALTNILMVIALIGLWRTRSVSRNRFAHALVLGGILYFILTSATSVAYSRFRVPIQLLIDCYAVAGVFYLIKGLVLFRVTARQKWLVHRNSQNISPLD